MFKCLISFLIWLIAVLPLTLIGFLIVPVMLLFKWQGYTTLWGNLVWGNGAADPAYAKTGFWSAYLWLAWRNPVNNLQIKYFAAPYNPLALWQSGSTAIGDNLRGGSYWGKMNGYWEYYLIKPYTICGSRRCVKFRAGWKLFNSRIVNNKAEFVFDFNPFASYSGI